MANLLIIAVIGLIIGLAAGYVYKEKKKGSPCVGCPYGSACASKGKNCSCSGSNSPNQ